MDCELNALQNGRIASCQIQFADERRNAWRGPVDSYRGVICLSGADEMGKDHDDGADHD